MNKPTINYPRCNYCKYAEVSTLSEHNGECHLSPPVLVQYEESWSFLYPTIDFKTGGCSFMEEIDELVESEFEEVTEFDEDDRPSPPPSSNSTRREIVHECMGENGSLVICKETI